MDTQIDSKTGLILLGVISAIILGQLALMAGLISLPSSWSILIPSAPSVSPKTTTEGLEKFTSEKEFKTYLQEATTGYAGFDIMGARTKMLEELTPISMPSLEAGMPERVSETTVQVAGVDEPDIVKTDGQEIYFSLQDYYWPRQLTPGVMESLEMIIYPPPDQKGQTKIIKAFPPEDLNLDAEIEKRGTLLLSGDMLVIFGQEEIWGYDVSNPEAPEKKWEIGLKEKNYLLSARLYQGKIYLVTQTRIDTYHPCPIEPLSVGGETLSIACTDIYHPAANIAADVTYNAMVVNPGTGNVEGTASFVGTSGSSILYMSENALYVSYSYYGDFVRFIYNFFNEECRDIIPDWIIEKMSRLIEYDISDAAKYTEFMVIFEEFQNGLEDDEALRIENELSNRMDDYAREHKRELEKTGIAKINLAGLDVTATGNVPGRALNQFSLDEYQSNLRVATTVSGSGMFGGAGEEANDVYVLNSNLQIVGSVQDLGLEEDIYSVRFLEDKGYIVTFRQIDPFFVLDLADPRNPTLKGELKIPGYSSYLHPITKDNILGIGKEDWKVKISLFDVKNPDSPEEADKYILDESWSDVLNTHHAFLLDKKHQVFFLPGSQGGYIFSYENDELKLIRAVSNVRAKRAIYLDDYLYIIGEDKIVVLNEINWERVNEMEF